MSFQNQINDGTYAPQQAAIPPVRVEAVVRPITDTDRLNWLIQHSALDDREGSPIQLVVTTRAVATCAGTHLPEYHAAVRSCIDAHLSFRPNPGADLRGEKAVTNHETGTA